MSFNREEKGGESETQVEGKIIWECNKTKGTDNRCLPSYPHTASLKGSGVSGARGKQSRSMEEKKSMKQLIEEQLWC